MQDFHIGQRWFSEHELELGLGEITKIDQRSVTVYFYTADEQRTYSILNAPLVRLQHDVGDTIQTISGLALIVTHIEQQNNLYLYSGHCEDGTIHIIHEKDLAQSIVLNKPINRLHNGQIDSYQLFILRVKTQNYYSDLLHSPVFGLYGARVSLIPHQLFIAQEVSTRQNPRVILADEVGLGKTIEAGLILHKLILSYCVSRVLIVVPDTLIYQWLVELLRKFNLKFSIFDEYRCEAFDDISDDNVLSTNPFESEQLIICSLSFIVNSERRQHQLLSCKWDMLIVDEAHHLFWSKSHISNEYSIIEKLASHISRILLLTATPEQLGIESHFARLKLLDPDRFFDFAVFNEEHDFYLQVANIAELILSQKPLNDTNINIIKNLLKHNDTIDFNSLKIATTTSANNTILRTNTLNLLIDCHGTSRIFFRNTRNTIFGFPIRIVHSYALDHCEEYNTCINNILNSPEHNNILSQNLHKPIADLLLTPELVYQSMLELGGNDQQLPLEWWNIDPRVEWLVTILKQLIQTKVLVICAHQFTVLGLEKLLKTKYGIRVTVFHENLSIIERDRSAAYFSSDENGAQVLICSEIGSEGRNFQFSHNLVFFDLPPYPDLLEQRIGRLDRIGQKYDIHLHIPYISESTQEIMFRWYHEGLDAFQHISMSGQTLYDTFKNELHSLILADTTYEEKNNEINNLVQTTIKSKKKLDKELQKGRDKLLELNSYNAERANFIVDTIKTYDLSDTLKNYIVFACEIIGIEFEPQDKNTFVMNPSSHMLLDNFPELPPDGVTVTFDRETALSREEILYLTWEHPMVIGLMELILANEHGNTSLIVTKVPRLEPFAILIEGFYFLESTAPKHYQVSKYLPKLVLRVLVNEKAQDISEQISISDFKVIGVSLNKEQIKQLISLKKDTIDSLVKVSKERCLERLPDLIESSLEMVDRQYNEEIKRLEELRLVNPNIKDLEIELLQMNRDKTKIYIQDVTIRLDTLRLIINQ